MTSQWSPYSIFKGSLQRRDLAAVRAAAAELPRLPLVDAFAILLLILEQLSVLYERGALHWVSRPLAERRHLALRHAGLTARYLAALADPARAGSGAAALAELAGDLGLPQLRAHLRSRTLA